MSVGWRTKSVALPAASTFVPKYIVEGWGGRRKLQSDGDGGVCIEAYVLKGEQDDIEADVPTKLLPSITKITMRLGLNLANRYYFGYNPWAYNHLDTKPNKDASFLNKGWFVYDQNSTDVSGHSTSAAKIIQGLSEEARTVDKQSDSLYYIGLNF